jgi:hypothetical protein
MGTCTQLSHQLLDLGFFSALGTTEHAGPRSVEIVVKRGTPATTDYNNGVLVIYDEVGRPWIRHYDLDDETDRAIRQLQIHHKMRHGATVPHSNDGGYFVREVLPTLGYAIRETPRKL